jgi:hypothetical protein
VQDVLVRGISIIGAAMVWDVQPEDLEHWVKHARDERDLSEQNFGRAEAGHGQHVARDAAGIRHPGQAEAGGVAE